jgi:DNA-binding LacI/PurR family transcriptional regulator
LAAAARVGIATVKRLEAGYQVSEPTIEKIQKVLEDAGLEFIPIGGKSTGGGAGVRAR